MPKGDTFPPGTERPADDTHAPGALPERKAIVPRGVGRTLRKGPIVLMVGGVLAVVVLAIGFAIRPQQAGSAKPEATAPRTFTQGPAIPDVIRLGPTSPSAEGRTEVTPTLPGPLSPRGGFGASPRSGPRYGSPSPGAAESGRMGPGAIRRTLEERRAHESDQKAANAGVLFDAKGAPASPPMPVGAPVPSPGGPTAGSGPAMALARGGAAASEEDPMRQDRKNAFLDSQGASKTTDYLQTSLQHPRSPFELKAGSIIPTVLVTGINSDLPGPVIGQVRENVYDTVTGNYLLIPQGARLLATYDSMVSWGQERVLVCWNRLIFPNGDSVNLQCMPAGDLEGAAGLTDEVNEHWWRLLKGAAIASLLAATSQGAAGNVSSYNPTVQQQWAAGGASELNQVGQGLVRRDLNVQPTITVRPGFSVNVLVTKDVVLPPYGAGAGIARLSSQR